MPTNKNALRKQGVNKTIYFKRQLNFNTIRGVLAYENMRLEWVKDHLNHTQVELIEACKSLAKVCGLKLINDYQCLWEFNHGNL